MKISGVVLVKNEEKNVIDCLDSLGFLDEIIVVDDNSLDRTHDLVEEYRKDHSSVHVFKNELAGNFSAQREFGIDKAKNDWILFIDADERITKDLSEEISDLIESDYGGYLIPRIDFMWGKMLKHGESGSIKLLRLFDKNSGKLKGTVHETWETKKRVGSLIHPIYHYPHQNITDFLRKINFYTDLRAKELYLKGVKSNFLSIIVYSKGKFLINYIVKLGFLDGVAGFVHAMIMSFHSFLVRGKLWMLWQNKKTS